MVFQGSKRIKKINKLRKRVFDIIEVSEEGDVLSDVYDSVMLIAIIISIIPLIFKTYYRAFLYTDRITTTLFIWDYILRWCTADYRSGKKSILTFVKYPFTFWAIIDLLSILPTLTIVHSSLKLLRLLRIGKTLRVFRVFKALRYSKNISIIHSVIHESEDALAAVFSLAGGYVLISALILFNVEPGTFDTFFDAVYWAAITLTTVGYGDIHPVSTVGRLVTMVSSILGIAVVALPAGIITAGYLNVLQEKGKNGDIENQTRQNKD